MKALTSLLVALAPISSSLAIIVVYDDFSSYAAGNIPNAAWNDKWDGGDTTQRDLFDPNGTGEVVLDLEVAKRQYRAVNSTGFTLTSDRPSGSISGDFFFTHDGSGNITSNQNNPVFGILITDQPQWWNGANEGSFFSNRGGAWGNKLFESPWIEGWNSWSSVGLDTTTGGNTEWINLRVDLIDDGSTILATPTYTVAATNFSFTGGQIDTGIASGSTLYGGFDTAWNGVVDGNGDPVPISTFSAFTSVTADNFLITLIPEPSRAMLVFLGLFGIVIRRRR